MSEYSFKMGDRAWLDLNQYLGAPEATEVPVTVVDVGEDRISVRLENNRTIQPGLGIIALPDQLSPRIEEGEPPGPPCALLNLVWRTKSSPENRIRFGVLIVKQEDAPSIIPDLERSGASIIIAGENMLIGDAVSYIAEMYIAFEMKVKDIAREDDDL